MVYAFYTPDHSVTHHSDWAPSCPNLISSDSLWYIINTNKAGWTPEGEFAKLLLSVGRLNWDRDGHSVCLGESGQVARSLAVLIFEQRVSLHTL